VIWFYQGSAGTLIIITSAGDRSIKVWDCSGGSFAAATALMTLSV
jgi:hypothetical protein